MTSIVFSKKELEYLAGALYKELKLKVIKLSKSRTQKSKNDLYDIKQCYLKTLDALNDRLPQF